MTLFWTMNPCALSTNTVYTSWNAQGYRKALYTQLFFLFLIYFISQLLQSLIYRTSTTNKQLRQPIAQSQQQNTKKQLPWHDKKWKRTFAMIFSHNCIGIGMCVLFSPFGGAVAVAYLHLCCFIVYCVLEVRHMVLAARICRIVMDVFNLILILIGLIGINFATCNPDFTCPTNPLIQLTNFVCFN